MDEQNEQMRELGERLCGLRDACDMTVEEMAAELGVSPGTYREWEETGQDVPISALYHIARKFNVELTEILTGTSAHLDTYHVVRRGEGEEVNRFPGYHYDDMAWRYKGKAMQPLMVVLDPTEDVAPLVSHHGQEFNFVVEGSIIFTFGDEDIVLNEWDSVYFNPEYPHGQRCNGDKTAKFITVITE